MSESRDHLKLIFDYLERSTHWREGGTDRHTALKVAFPALEESIHWTEQGLAEWRSTALAHARHAEAARATARVAINHLQAVLNKPRSFEEQQQAERLARDWLLSIGSEP